MVNNCPVSCNHTGREPSTACRCSRWSHMCAFSPVDSSRLMQFLQKVTCMHTATETMQALCNYPYKHNGV